MKIRSEYFYGNKVSEYGIEHGFVDYRTLAEAFDAVLNNSIMEKTFEIGYWDQISGIIDNTDAIEELEDKIEELEDQQEAEGIDNADEIEKLKDEIEELEDDQEYPPEVFQWYIVSEAGADILQEAEEVVYYNSELDMYLWGVTHYGTSWDYVLTNIEICRED